MTHRQRLLAVLERRPPDRVPWVPRLALWYRARQLSDTLPAKYQGKTLREVERALGAGSPARSGRIYTTQSAAERVVRRACPEPSRRDGAVEIAELHTPVGTVRQVSGHSEVLRRHGLPGRVREHWLKTPDDYRVWEWIVEHRHYLPAYEAYEAYDEEIGDDGLPMVRVEGCPFYELVQDLVGINHAYYHLADHPNEVNRLLAVMTACHRERLWPVVAGSPARLILNAHHLCTDLTPPALYERYVLPYYRELNPLLRERGKWTAMHADADTSAILEPIERSGWDMVECFLTAPMARVTLAEARAAWGDRLIIWGGLPSSIFSPGVPEVEFRRHVHDVLDTIAPGDAFILGIADNAMPDSLIERIQWASDAIRERAVYPIQPRGGRERDA